MGTARLGDVGGWFRTATDGAVALPQAPGWGPGTGGFGQTSTAQEIRAALEVLRGARTMVLTGAGMSTGSGLPDYRGRDAVPRSPMLYQEFVGSDLSRRRYWARSTVGWRHFMAARPGPAHHALATLERRLSVAGVVTQNVDGLHQRAGSRYVVDLHGRLDRVICLDCGALDDRVALQEEFLALNPEFVRRLDAIQADAEAAPDGDAEVDRTETFRYPPCAFCGGMLKPDVVFFGENAHRGTVEEAFRVFDDADAVLVLGSSLTVMSGLRFCRRGRKEGKPVVIVNDGLTRGDDLATHRIHGRLEMVLPEWLSRLA